MSPLPPPARAAARQEPYRDPTPGTNAVVASDVIGFSDATDTMDATDATGVTDTTDTTSVIDVADVADVADATDTTDTTGATDTTGVTDSTDADGRRISFAATSAIATARTRLRRVGAATGRLTLSHFVHSSWVRLITILFSPES